jgi:iron(III) transport system permease protein
MSARPSLTPMLEQSTGGDTIRRLRGVVAGAGWLPLIVVIGFAVVWPLVSLEAQGFSGGLATYRDAYSLPGIGRTFETTIALGLASTLVAVIVGTLLAWCSLHLPSRLVAIGTVVPLMPLVVPGVAAVTGWVFLLTPRVGYLNELIRKLPPFSSETIGPLNIYTFGGMVFASGLIFASFTYLFVYNGLRGSGQEYEEAALLFGASPLRAFLTVTLPQLRPSLAYGGGIVFMLSVGQFAVPLILGVPAQIDVLTIRMFDLLQGFPIPFGEAAALGSPLLAAGVLALVVQRWVIGDTRRYVTTGGRAQSSPRIAAWWAAPAILGYALLAVVLPIAALLYVALSPYWSGSLSASRLTSRHFTELLTDPYLVSAITTSLGAAFVSILIVLPLGYWVARIIAHRVDAPGAAVRVLDLLSLLPYGTPAILFGFSLLFAYTRAPFVLYGTPAIIIVAYCTIMLPYATRLELATLLALGEEPWDAARISGAGPIRTFASITVPLMQRGVAAAAAIVFILLFQEFGVSLMVRSPSVQVMGGVLYDQYSGGIYPRVAVLAILMVAITAVGVGVMLTIGGADALMSPARAVEGKKDR